MSDRFQTIVADPPWPYPSPGGNLVARPEHRPNSYGTGAPDSRAKYGAMSIAEIAALAPPVEDNAHLYLWTTNAFMVEAHDIAKAWGFRPVTIGTWVKTKPDGSPSMKTGYYFRGATEHFVFAVRGSLRLQSKTAYPTAFLWPRLPHSVKPDQFYDLVEACSPWPWLELFARRKRLGWAVWGDEVESDVEIAS